MLLIRRFLAGIALFATCGFTFAQSLNLTFTNSSAYSNDDIWITFQTSNPSSINATVNGSPLNMIYSGTYQYLDSGTMVTSTQTSYWSESMNLTQLTAGTGLNFVTAPSVRAYVSYASPLTFSGSGVNGGLLSFGSPSYSSTADPNYLKRWDVFELTVTPSPNDQGDITAINGMAIPMRMTSYINSTPVQSTQTTTNFNQLLSNLESYQTANAANNVSNLPTTVTNSGTFTRIVGINNGAQSSATVTGSGNSTVYSSGTSGGGATIGANADFGAYVNHIQSSNITTPLKFDTAAVISGTNYGFNATLSGTTWNPSGTYTATWTGGGTNAYTYTGSLGSITTSGTGAALKVEGDFTANGTTTGQFSVLLPPDVKTGSADTSNYLQSATIYAGTAVANFGLIFTYSSGTAGTPMTYYNVDDFVYAVGLDNAGQGLPLIQQVFHDLASGLNFGLVGSDVIDPLSNMSFNDEGSEYWTMWETLKNGGTVITTTGTWSFSGDPGTTNPGTMPFYADAQGSANGYYNQWAALIYNSSTTAYGNPYSDYLQEVDVNLLSSPEQNTYNITSVNVTFLPDGAPIPEPSVVALFAVGGGLGIFTLLRKRRRGRPSESEDSD